MAVSDEQLCFAAVLLVAVFHLAEPGSSSNGPTHNEPPIPPSNNSTQAPRDWPHNEDGECVDEHPLCQFWKNSPKTGCDGFDRAYMKSKCRGSCNEQPCGLKLMLKHDCNDKNDKCADWFKQDQCAQNPYFMFWQCLKTCTVCDRIAHTNLIPLNRLLDNTNNANQEPDSGEPAAGLAPPPALSWGGGRGGGGGGGGTRKVGFSSHGVSDDDQPNPNHASEGDTTLAAPDSGTETTDSSSTDAAVGMRPVCFFPSHCGGRTFPPDITRANVFDTVPG